MNQDLLDFIKHLTAQDTKTLSQKALKLTEEVGELARVVLPYESASGTTHRFTDKDQMLEELADIQLVNLSILFDLGFTIDDLSDIMQKKSMKWSGLQSRERAANFPVPYEIHITVANARVPEFKNVCNQIGIKPLLLDLQNRSGENVLFDLMTSQVHVGNNTSAYAAMKDSAQKLTNAGFQVIREKIETVPWHPAAPKSTDHNGPTMPPNCYFESHIAVLLSSDRLNDLKDWVARYPDIHLSKNAFKTYDQGMIKMMITYREYYRAFEHYEEMVQLFYNELLNLGYAPEKPIIEFSIFDSKISHDAAWIQK